MATGTDVKPEQPGTTSARKQAQPRKSTPKPTTATPPGTAARAKRRTATVNLPFMTAEFRVPEVHAPEMHLPHPGMPSVHVPSVHLARPHVPHASGQDVTNAARVVRSYLPPRDQLALYAGLGAGAVAGLIDWPVAAAVSAGPVVAALETRFAVAVEELGTVRRVRLDTFDWRLHRAGFVLEQIRDQLSELALSTHEPDQILEQPGQVRWPSLWTVGPPRLRDRLEPIVGVRALLPVVETEQKTVRAAATRPRREHGGSHPGRGWRADRSGRGGT